MSDFNLPIELLSEISSFWDVKYLVRFLTQIHNKSLIAYVCEESDLFNELVLDFDCDINSNTCFLSQMANLVLFITAAKSSSCKVSAEKYFQAVQSTSSSPATQPQEGDEGDEELDCRASSTKKPCSIQVRNMGDYQLKYLVKFSEVLCKIRRVSSLLFEDPSIANAVSLSYSLIEQISNSPRLSMSLDSVRYRTSNCHYQGASWLYFQTRPDEYTTSPNVLTNRTVCMNRLKHWDFSYVFGYYHQTVNYQPVLLPSLESIQLAGKDFQGFLNYDQFQYQKWLPNIRKLSLLNLTTDVITRSTISKYVMPENLNVLSLKQMDFTPKQFSDLISLFPNLSTLEFTVTTSKTTGDAFDFLSSSIRHRNLRHLALGSHAISNADIECLPEVFPNIESLTILDALPKVHAASFGKLARMNKLLRLNLSRCPTFDAESFCSIFSSSPLMLRQLVELSLYIKSDDSSIVTELGRVVHLLSSLRHISFRGRIKRVRSELQRLLSKMDLCVNFVTTHVNMTNLYVAEDVDVENTEQCSENCIDNKCGCQRKPCVSCSIFVPSCCQLDHEFVCRRRTHTDYTINCPTCGDTLKRDVYHEHMNEYHLESTGATNRQGRSDTTFWRCPMRGCSCTISIPTYPVASLFVRLGRAKVSHLYHECQFNLVYDILSESFKTMCELGIDRSENNQDIISVEHIKNLHQRRQPQFHELISKENPFAEYFKSADEARRRRW